MVSRQAAWMTRMRPRWFVRVAAVCAALANLAAVILWFGGLSVVGEDAPSVGEAVPSVLVAVIAALATSQIILRGYELPGHSFPYRYLVVVSSFCLGGAIMGGLLAMLFVSDGTVFTSKFADLYAEGPVALLSGLGWSLLVALVGVGYGLVVGLAEGLVLALPLAAVLGALRNGD